MKKLKLTIDLLPRGAWGSNLSKSLSQRDWDILRRAAYERAGYKCCICGAGGQLEAHEVWDFDIETETQTLIEIIGICKSCHMVKHFRHTKLIGGEKQAKQHFIKINECDEATFEAHFETAVEKFEALSEVEEWKNGTSDLEKFGGKGIDMPRPKIMKIINPYEAVDFETYEGLPLFEIKRNDTFWDLPPKIISVSADSQEGKIIVTARRTDKIQWLSLTGKDDTEGNVIKTIYNNVGKFISKFNVKGIGASYLRFKLTGAGGQALSLPFTIVDKETEA